MVQKETSGQNVICFGTANDVLNHRAQLANGNRSRAVFSWAALVCSSILFLLAMIPIWSTRFYGPDEWEHLHAAWCISQGQVPYKDFFEHHMPWHQLTMAPWVRWLRPQDSYDRAVLTLQLARAWSVLWIIVAAAFTWAAARRWAGEAAGVVAAILFFSSPVVFWRGVETRPDTQATAWLAAALCLASRGADEKRQVWWLGFLCGGALACTQKALFLLPGFAAGLWLNLSERPSRRVQKLAVWGGGVLVMPTLIWVWLAASGAGWQYVASNFLLNARWQTWMDPIPVLKNVLFENWMPFAAAALALPIAWGARHSILKSGRFGRLLIYVCAAGLAGLAVLPVVWPYYYLLWLPAVCCLAARTLVSLLPKQRFAGTLLTMTCLGAYALTTAWHLRVRSDPTYLHQQRAALRHVHELTQPGDLILEGGSGPGVFRPHAFFYFFLHEEIRQIIPQRQVEALLAQLRNGVVKPKLIVLDRNLSALEPRLNDWVRTNCRIVSPEQYTPDSEHALWMPVLLRP